MPVLAERGKEREMSASEEDWPTEVLHGGEPMPRNIAKNQRIVDAVPRSLALHWTFSAGAKLKYVLDLRSQDREVQLHRKVICELNASDVSVQIYAILRGNNHQRISLDLHLHHGASHTHSVTYICTVAEDSSRIRTIAKISAAERIECCDAHLQNRNLLLSPAASVETTPILDIQSNDIRCSHGATVSGPRPDEIFYLRSRGISEVVARQIIRDAFIAQATGNQPND
ncbi:MAG: SufD family Fe-S cluster assembly protein [Puniceicoccales bacterium]|jgi:hypothetical protein|nr:SufD family Fe-S cluster assembly protein [Puniceicoccales bacterium]